VCVCVCVCDHYNGNSMYHCFAANVNEHDTINCVLDVVINATYPFPIPGYARELPLANPDYVFISKVPSLFIPKVHTPAKDSVVDQRDKQCNKHFRVGRDVACVASLFRHGKLVG
jgi:hypothetical protein